MNPILFFGQLMNNESTLGEARAYVRAGRGKGTYCPCCDQFAKVYKRSIPSVGARLLVVLYHLTKQQPDKEYFHIVDDILRAAPPPLNVGGDVAKLAYWGLVVEKPKDPDDTTKRTSGYWKITNTGKAFAENNRRVTRYVLLYDSKVIGLEGEPITIKDALKNKFNYEELMSR